MLVHLIIGSILITLTLQKTKPIPAQFPNILNATCIYRPEREAHWFAHPLKNGFVFAPDNSIRTDAIREPLDILLNKRDNYFIYILSGVHGERRGSNWIQENNKSGDGKFDEEHIIRKPKLADDSFFRKDLKAYWDKLPKKYQPIAKQISIFDISLWSYIKFRTLLEDKWTHVILAFCYARNDHALRYHLNLSSVPSFTKDLNPQKCDYPEENGQSSTSNVD